MCFHTPDGINRAELTAPSARPARSGLGVQGGGGEAGGPWDPCTSLR